MRQRNQDWQNEPGMSARSNEIENRRWGTETSKRPARRGVPLRCSRVGSGGAPVSGSGGAPVGWARNGRAVKAPPLRGRGMRQTNRNSQNEPGMSAEIKEIENRRRGDETSKRPALRGVPLRCARVGSGGAPVGWARNGRAVKALPYAAENE